MRFQLIALDLDGTLMGESRIIPERTRRAMQTAMDGGCRVTVSTGRAFATASRFAQDLGINAPLICYQGALIQDLRDGTIIHKVTIPPDVARQVAAFAQARQLNFQVLMEDNRAYTDRVKSVADPLLGRSGMPVTAVGDLAAWLDRPPFKFLFTEQPEAMPELVHDLQAQFDDRVRVTQSLDHLVEVTAPEASKGQALARLAAHLGVAQSATMAIGDHDNDVSMIAWAGLGVAMGNASSAAKAAADVIAPSLDEEGAAWAIERYVLEG